MNSIASRIVLTSVALVLCTAATIGAIQYKDFTKDHLEKRQEQLATLVQREAQYLKDITEDARRNVIFLSETPPIQGIVRARANNGIDSFDGSSETIWKDRLARIFEGMAKNNSQYLQIRYISIDNNGQEIVRVDRTSEGVGRIAEQKLQQKGSRDYITSTIAAPAGSFSLFDIDLNREFNVIERPMKPVMRVATPVYTDSGVPFGVIVININMKQVLARMSAGRIDDARIYLTNERGDYLAHPERSKTFGFEFGNVYRIQDDIKELGTFVVDNDQHNFSGSISFSEGLQLSYLEKIPFEDGIGDQYLIAGVFSPESSLWAGIRKTRNDVILITLVFAFVGGGLAYLFARVIVKPLTELTVAAEKLESGVNIDEIAQPRTGTNEVGHLTQTFFSMASALRDRQDKLEEKEANIRAILETADNPIITFDNLGNILSANPATSALFGYPDGKLAELNISELVSGLSIGRFDSMNQHGAEFAALLANGEGAPLQLSISKVRNKGSNHYTVILTDLREQKKIDRLKSELHEQKRMDNLKSEFVSTVSHELRTPLTSIMGSLGLVRSGAFGALSEKASDLLDMAQSNGERLVCLINDILDIEKIQSGSFKFSLGFYSLNILLSDANKASEGYAIKHNTTIFLEPLAQDVKVKVDEGRFAQVMANLLSNAIKFSARGSVVRITALIIENGVRISVCDEGSGIPHELQGRIFEKFTQADSSSTRTKDGTGLGLSITKAIVERFDGTIAFTSESDRGSTFFFELPVDVLAISHSQPERQTHREEGMPKILIVADNSDALSVLLKILDGCGDILTATTGQDAEQILLSDRPDVVILDLQLPDSYGLDLAHQYFSDPATSPKLIIYSVEDVPAYRIPPEAVTLVKSHVSIEQLRTEVNNALQCENAAGPSSRFANSRQ